MNFSIDECRARIGIYSAFPVPSTVDACEVQMRELDSDFRNMAVYQANLEHASNAELIALSDLWNVMNKRWFALRERIKELGGRK